MRHIVVYKQPNPVDPEQPWQIWQRPDGSQEFSNAIDAWALGVRLLDEPLAMLDVRVVPAEGD